MCDFILRESCISLRKIIIIKKRSASLNAWIYGNTREIWIQRKENNNLYHFGLSIIFVNKPAFLFFLFLFNVKSYRQQKYLA